MNNIYGIIEETDGITKEFTIYDMRTCRAVGKIHSTKEEAEKEKATLLRELYQGSGVYGNEI